MEILCKTCVVLAACKGKKHIDCELLYEILRQEVKFNKKTDKLGSICQELRDSINNTFPNVKTITKITGMSPRLIFKGFK